MITATQKTGFLIDNPAKLGCVIGQLRAFAAISGQQFARDLAEWLNDVPYRTYYEPIQLPLMETIEVVEGVQK